MSKELAFYNALRKMAKAKALDADNPRVKSNTFTPLVDIAVAMALSEVAMAYKEVFLE